jgi:G3E family GTPase
MSWQQTPVVVLTGLTRATLEPVEASVAFGLPAPALLRYELDVLAGHVTRVVSDATGVVEHEQVPLDHTCLSCALRHEVVPTLTRLAGAGRWESFALSLPPATQPRPMVEALVSMVRVSAPVRRALRVGAVVTALTGSCLVPDLFGDDLLRERDEERHAGDVRAVGEVLADAVEYADVLALSDGHDDLGQRERAVLDELRHPASQVVHDAVELGADELLVGSGSSAADWVHHAGRTPAAADLLVEDRVLDATSPSALEAGVWTVYVDTWRPFHPQRLMDRIESLGGHGYRGRGCFWLPTHPDRLAQWDGAGGQLSIGTVAGAPARGPRTRLVITGVDDRRDAALTDLDAALMTDAELAAGLAGWAGKDDGFDPWLGDRRASA